MKERMRIFTGNVPPSLSGTDSMSLTTPLLKGSYGTSQPAAICRLIEAQMKINSWRSRNSVGSD
jgi:hypothetical protein